MEPHHIARLFIAAFLVAVWSARRTERAALYWGVAYGSYALGSMARTYGLNHGLDLLVITSAIGPAIYIVGIWAGAQHFRQRVSHLGYLAGAAAAVTAAIVFLLIVAPDHAVPFVGFLVATSTAWAAHAIWVKSSRYRFVAALMYVQAGLLFLITTVMRTSEAIGIALAVVYGLLAIGLAYVMLKESEETILRQSTHDPVTRLPNRRLMLDQMDALLRSAATDHTAVAVLFLNINRFKRINDLFGHAAADGVLTEIAQRLSALGEILHTVARYGADEFVLVTSGASANKAMQRAENLAEKVTAAFNSPFAVSGAPTMLTVRMGIEVSAGHALTAETMIQHAGLASARGKGIAESPLHYYSDQMQQRAMRALAIERCLRTALTNGELYLDYQPIIELPSRQTRKAEALLRWNSAELGRVGPDELIPVAESTGLIIEIGAWVLDEACRQAALWAASRATPIAVSVNVSARQIHDRNFCGLVSASLAAHRLEPGLVEIEMTESVIVIDDPVMRANLARLREMGLRLSLDDFGTGFSSLSYLTRFELDTLKIDQSFVREIENDERSRRLAESICAIGRSLDLELIAEGVESDGQVKVLTGFGVSKMQGFLFGRPGPAEAIGG